MSASNDQGPPTLNPAKSGPTNSSDRGKLALVVVLMTALVALGVWALITQDSDSGAEDQPTMAVESLQPTEASALPSLEPVPKPEPSPTYEGDDGDGRFGEDEPPPTFAPASDRVPQDVDDANGRAVIEEAIPVWAQADTSQGAQIPAWAEPLYSMDAVGQEFITRSREQFGMLFGGAVQMDVSVANPKLASVEPLWNIGSHSLWRVTITRDLVPNGDGPASTSSETVTFDFLIAQSDDETALQAFLPPTPNNESPDTFYLPEVL